MSPRSVRIQELDGTFNHTVQVEEKATKINISCHSRARRNKKKKIPLLTGEEADIDLSQSDQGMRKFINKCFLELLKRIDFNLIILVLILNNKPMWGAIEKNHRSLHSDGDKRSLR